MCYDVNIIIYSGSRWPTVCKMDAWRSFFRDVSAFIDRIAEEEHRATANVAESVVSKISNYQPVAILQSRKCDMCTRAHTDHVISRAESARCRVRFSDRSFYRSINIFRTQVFSIHLFFGSTVTSIDCFLLRIFCPNDRSR